MGFRVFSISQYSHWVCMTSSFLVCTQQPIRRRSRRDSAEREEGKKYRIALKTVQDTEALKKEILQKCVVKTIVVRILSASLNTHLRLRPFFADPGTRDRSGLSMG